MEKISKGDINGLKEMFVEEVGITGDGGGQVYAIKRPIYGAQYVAKFRINISKLAPVDGVVQFGEVLNQPVVLINGRNQCIAAYILSVSAGQITNIFAVRNPLKLSRFNK